MSFSKGFEKIANVLTAKTRKAIADEDFALPGRRYPIENLAHARNALSRVAQNGTPEEQATVRAKVHSKFPELKKQADVASKIKGVGKHLAKYKRDYLLGTAAAGSLGTAVGSNRGKK
jgi:hypothetical protein